MKKRILSLLFAFVLTFSSVSAFSVPVHAANTVYSGYLTLAIPSDYPPYTYKSDGTLIGIETEIASIIAARLGLVLRITEASLTDVYNRVISGKADIGMGGIPTLAELTDSSPSFAVLGDRLSFTAPYTTNTQVLLVPADSAITSLNVLFSGSKRYTVGVKTNSTAELLIYQTLVSPGKGFSRSYATASDAVSALKSGTVQALMLDKALAETAVSADSSLKILSSSAISESYCVITAKNSPVFSEVSRILSELVADGTVQNIVDRYLLAGEPAEKPVYTNPFRDVSESDWFYQDVMRAVELKLVNGKTATTFVPQGNLLICEAVKLAACMHQLYHTGKITLTNASGGAWYNSYVDYAVQNGIITANQFKGRYENSATRAEYVTIFAKALPESEFSAINSIADNKIPDVRVSASYGADVYRFYRAGILTGSGDTATRYYFLPNQSITRAEVAVILTRMMDKSARRSITLG